MSDREVSERRIHDLSTLAIAAALLFAVPGAGLLLRVPHFTQDMAHLGYPVYFLVTLGTWKLLGAVRPGPSVAAPS